MITRINPILASKLDKEDATWKKRVVSSRKSKNKKRKTHVSTPFSMPIDHRDSSGEAVIADILRKHNILFCQEKEFDTCFNKDTGCRFRFDFYLPGRMMVIEYDGQQHFEACSFNGNGLRLLEIQRRDRYKEKWCFRNGIKVLRIKYTDKHKISEIILASLNKIV